MKPIMLLTFVLLTLTGPVMAADVPTTPNPPTAGTGEITLEWNYPAEMNAAILGFRIYHSRKSIPWGKHRGELPPADANAQMIQVDDPSLRVYKLLLPEGSNYIRMNAIYTQNNQVVESFFSEQIKITVKAAPGTPPSPSDLKLRNTVPTKLRGK